VRAGLLEPRDGDAAVTEAIAADESLTERQRQVLLEIYAAFQSENAAMPAASTTESEPTTDPTTTGTTSAGASSPKKDQS